MDWFPWATHVYNRDQLFEIYNKIKAGQLIDIDYNSANNDIKFYNSHKYDKKFYGKNITLIVNVPYQEYKHKYLWITDYFQEKARMNCRRKGSDFELSKFRSLGESIKDRHIQDRRNIIINKITSWCGTYPIGIALTIYQTFKPQKILDMSAGWGDRLLAATMYNPKLYVGADPNSSLFEGYNKIIETFVKPEDRQNYILINSAFENVDLKDNKFDLMFSSPPYFIGEEYSKDEGQAYLNYSEMDLWLKNFMFKSIDKIWLHLEDGGIFALDLNNLKIQDKIIYYIDTVNDYINKMPNSENLGVIKHKYKFQNHTTPIWIWRKIPY